MPKAEKFTLRDLDRKQKENRWRASSWLVEGQDAGWRRKTNNLYHLNIHFQLHHFLLHYVSRQLRRYKCVIFIYKALLRFKKKKKQNWILQRKEAGGKNSCKVAVFSQDKWGGLSPWKHSSHGCLSEDRDVCDGVMAKKDILNSKGLYKQLLLLYIQRHTHTPN